MKNGGISPEDDRDIQGSMLGDIWTASAAQNCKSLAAGTPLRICFRNHCDYPLILCFVDAQGHPHHFYQLDPFQKKPTPWITSEDHIENTCVGHAFLVAYSDDIATVKREKSLQEAILVGGYRAKRTTTALSKVSEKEVDTDSDSDYDGDEENDEEERVIHLVEIRSKDMGGKSFLPPRMFSCFCPSTDGDADDLRDSDGIEASDNEYGLDEWKVVVRLAKIDPKPRDTSRKPYVSTTLGGWPVRLDQSLLSEDVQTNKKRKILASCCNTLAKDLQYMQSCLPPEALKKLRETTPVWVNRSLLYGPEVCPVRGQGCCFHPDRKWLQKNGMNVEKEQCVEIYDIDNYNETCSHWGTGGIMLHEYSHAYHFKCLPQGYKNPEVIECYKAAMKEGLYDSVRVHGPQGPKARAYACQDQMEYFAELSAAFLGGKDRRQEYNKWYPFNRQQLKEHDPRAYKLLKKLWKVKDA